MTSVCLYPKFGDFESGIGVNLLVMSLNCPMEQPIAGHKARIHNITICSVVNGSAIPPCIRASIPIPNNGKDTIHSKILKNLFRSVIPAIPSAINSMIKNRIIVSCITFLPNRQGVARDFGGAVKG